VVFLTIVRRAALATLAVPAALVLVSAAQPAPPPPRFVLAASSGTASNVYLSGDGVRWSAGAAVTGTQAPAPVRRGGTLSLYDAATLAGSALGGPVHPFAVRGGRLVASPAAAYQIQLASPEDAARAAPGPVPVSAAVDDNGALVLLYGLRYEPDSKACPVAGQACLKLRTATETSARDGVTFTGDLGNRIVIGFDPADTVGPPALMRAEKGWVVLLQGPGGCLHVLTTSWPHGAYHDAGCILDQGPAGPSGLWDARLGEYRLYGVADGRVVRAVTGSLKSVAPARFRPLALPGRPSFVRVAPYAP